MNTIYMKTDPEKILEEIYLKLTDYAWFKPVSELNIENVLKFLTNKLIERDSSNHTVVCEFLKEINQ